MDEKEEPLTQEGSSIIVDLFLDSNDFYLPELKCALVYDKYARNSSPFSHQIRFRRVGLKFDELMEDQKRKLEIFMEHCTSGTA